MGSIYWNLKEIPIPAEAKVNHYDGQVSIYHPGPVRSRTVIGRATSDHTMHPNKNFKTYFPRLWEQYYGEKTGSAYEIHAGLYALALGIGHQTGLYPLLHEVFGPQDANTLMDFALYSMRERSSAAQLFQDSMLDQMLFSRKAPDDSRLSKLFGESITSAQIDKFRREWLKRCAARGIKRVWLCIDGSNNDCTISSSALAEPGKAKSGRNVNIVSFIWAVNADDSRPITWFVNPGGMHDAKAFDQIIKFLALSELETEGVIIDRGFASQEVLDLVKSLGLKFVVKLKSSAYACTVMMERHAAAIHGRIRHLLTNSRKGMFGITDQVKIFSHSREDSCVGLFFDSPNGNARSLHLNNKVLDEIERLKVALAAEPDQACVGPDFTAYLSIVSEADGRRSLQINWEHWQLAADGKGYSAVAASENMTAERMQAIYSARDCSEKQFSILKSQLDSGVCRVHSDAALQARFAAAFIAAIVRTELMLKCERLALDADVMLRRADRVVLVKMPDQRYHSIDNHSAKMLRLLNDCGIKRDDFEYLANDLNILQQEHGQIISQLRTLPGLEQHKATSGGAAGTQEKPQRRPGRPKGSKNKMTLEREAQAAGQPSQKVKRRPGRPKGSRSKKTLEREAAMADNPSQEKRRPGRPKGSKNKKTLEREALEAAQLRPRRGRPRGARNKPKPASADGQA